MSRRLALAALALAVAVLPAAAQQVLAPTPAVPQSLEAAQDSLRAAVALMKQERAAAQAEKAKAAAAAPKRVAQLACVDKKSKAQSLQGTLNLDTLSLDLSRAGVSKPVTQTDEKKVVDERCGKLLAALADSITYDVTSAGKWGQDLLQLPKTSAEASAKPFDAALHTCDYDGEWHADSDSVLSCTLTPQ
jgi:hypothetical protein